MEFLRVQFLGPLLFLIYINDLTNCLQHSTARMFRGAGATGAAGETDPVAETVRGRHGGNSLPFFTRTALRNLCVIHMNWNL